MKKTLLFTALTVAGTVTFVGSTFAFMGNDQGPKSFDPAIKEQIQTAMQNGDYAAFQEATKDITHFQNVTEEKFTEIAKKKTDKWAKHEERRAHHEKMKALVAAGDYQGRLAAEGNDHIKELIDTEEKFQKFGQLQALKEQMKTLSEELGLPTKRMRKGKGHGNGQKRGRGMFGGEKQTEDITS